MKKIKLFLFLFFPLIASAHEGDLYVPIPYSITKTEIDAKLPATQSKFTVTFYRDYNTLITSGKIKYAYNGKNKTAQLGKSGKINFIVAPGKYKLDFFYNDQYYEIKTDSILINPKHKIDISLFFESAVNPVMEDKPVIYVYPLTTTAINIKLETKGEIKFTYPEYNEACPPNGLGRGWSFTADPDGTIHANGKEYNYLFWEGEDASLRNEVKAEEGFIIEKKNLLSFFETNLTKMGLNTKEQQDFITYWYPRMMNNEKNYLRFIFNEAYDAYAHLDVTPKPDNVIRVFMVWSSFEGEIPSGMKAQEIPSFTRNGFTLVEWGGSEIKTQKL